MGHPVTLSVFLALIAAALAAPQDKKCEYTCVPYYQCRNNTIETGGIGLIHMRSGDPSSDSSTDSEVSPLEGVCEHYLDVCCKPPEQITPEEKPVPKPTVSSNPSSSCGQRRPDGVGLKITGQSNDEAQFGEFPWMVAVLREEVVDTIDEKLSVYQCGGALINSKAVLTAASCVNGKQPSELKIRAGEWDAQTKQEIFPHQDRDVETVVVHDKFDSDALYNDVAILILKTPVDLGETVDLVCLTTQDENFDPAGCLASGWGKDKHGKDGRYQAILKKIELPVVSNEECEISLRSTRLGKYFILDPSFICAGGEVDKDTCKGDGGSPLVCPLKNDPSRYAQVGIVAWGIGCGEDQVPGVYANIAYLRPWIDEQMTNHNLDTTVYQA